MLNSQSPIPLYVQLANILSDKIKSGEYIPGSRLPSENILAKIYSIGRPTVRQATEQLIHRGILERIRGSGTYVKTKAEEVDLFSLAGTSSAFKKKGIQITMHILHDIGLKKIKTDPNNPFYNKEAFFLSRLCLIKDNPILVEDLYFDPNIFPRLNQFKIKGHSLSQIVEDHYFMKPVSGRQSFKVGTVDKARAKKLAVNHATPLLIVNRSLHFKNAENAIYSILLCKTDQFSFSQTIGGTAYE